MCVYNQNEDHQQCSEHVLWTQTYMHTQCNSHATCAMCIKQTNKGKAVKKYVSYEIEDNRTECVYEQEVQFYFDETQFIVLFFLRSVILLNGDRALSLAFSWIGYTHKWQQLKKYVICTNTHTHIHCWFDLKECTVEGNILKILFIKINEIVSNVEAIVTTQRTLFSAHNSFAISIKTLSFVFFSFLILFRKEPMKTKKKITWFKPIYDDDKHFRTEWQKNWTMGLES